MCIRDRRKAAAYGEYAAYELSYHHLRPSGVELSLELGLYLGYAASAAYGLSFGYGGGSDQQK